MFFAHSGRFWLIREPDEVSLIDQMKFDIKKNTFVENYLPNHKIGIIHLAGKHNDVIRLNKRVLYLGASKKYVRPNPSLFRPTDTPVRDSTLLTEPTHPPSERTYFLDAPQHVLIIFSS